MTKIFFADISKFLNAPACDCLKFFSLERQREILRYKFNSDRNRTIFAELLARKAIFEMTGKKIFIQRDENGKPFCELPELFLSLSHSGNIIACSIGDENNGVDVENFNRKINLDVAKRFFLPSEYETVKNSGENWRKKFFEYWTIKESALKCFSLREWSRVDCEKLLEEKRARNFYLPDGSIAGVCVGSGIAPENYFFKYLSKKSTIIFMTGS